MFWDNLKKRMFQMKSKLFKYVLGVVVCLLVILGLGYPQDLSSANSAVIPFDSARWKIGGKQNKIEDYLGEKSLLLNFGRAIVKDSQFSDGIIEYDVAFGEGRGFAGALWRDEDGQNREEFYMRIHQSGNPDSCQYTPVFNGLLNWQLYSGEGYTARFKYPLNQWIHVKIVVAGKEAEVYVEDMSKPLLFIPKLQHSVKEGKIGLFVLTESTTPIHFANFSYVATNNPPLKGQVKEPKPTPPGTIMSWSVSQAFDEKSVDGKVELNKAEKQNLTWQKVRSESTGLFNIGRLEGIVGEKNTAFAKVTIISDTKQVKRLHIGFSDRTRLYLNNRLLYEGRDEFTSRDYRFLGTIGYYDAVYLPLKKGENELWLAISDTTDDVGGGGWGFQSRFDNMEGISLMING